jgi:hypothetical protein
MDWRPILWGQFGASIDMLENAIVACPEKIWSDRSRNPEVWYMVYHTLFWLDFYLSGTSQGFHPPAPFNLDEMDPAGILPGRVYTKAELLRYLEHGREKCWTTISALTEETARRPYALGRHGDITRAELLLYNMRHVQHHMAQLNLILRQETSSAPGWVGRAAMNLEGGPV